MTRAVLDSQAGSDHLISHVHDSVAFAVQTRSGRREMYGSGTPSFTIMVPDETYWLSLRQAHAYRVATAFVRGEFEVDGDLLQALRWWKGHASAGRAFEWMMGVLSRLRLESYVQSDSRARRNIRFHYDRSNLFYQQFLDRRMVYSCAYFAEPTWSLDVAQLAKLDHVCRKLDVRQHDRFLDVGCGWGALAIHAAQLHAANAVGCTLSAEQGSYANETVRAAGLSDRVTIQERDYRRLDGTFDRIASVGMFEHVGRRRLPEYFKAVARLLTPDGLFLNHGIVRPSSIREDGTTVFLQRRVFPGGELASLGEVIYAAERAGFEVLDVENLRPHYALTCAAWVRRLQQHRNTCLTIVDAETYRTWLLYLAGASISFERGVTEVHQILLAKRSAATSRLLTRAHVYSRQRAPRLKFTAKGPKPEEE